MVLELEKANAVHDLRLQFFPVTVPMLEIAPDRTYLVEVQKENATEQVIQSPLAVQCNCACK